MKIIIAGSRHITNYSLVRQAVISSGWWAKDIEIVSGMAAGVDTLAVEFAKRNSLVLHGFEAEWDYHGKAAGPIRNRKMAEFADALIAIWDGQSKGTENMIQEMTKRSKPTYILYANQYTGVDPI
jgi:hypothetical protein